MSSFVQALSKPLNVILLVAAIGFGRFLRTNPLLFGLDKMLVDSSTCPKDFRVIERQPVLDRILSLHQKELRDDATAYHNHCLRVLSFARYHLRMMKRQISERDMDIMALALAYHDIGLWVPEKALNYLEPSVATMERELLTFDNLMLPPVTDAELETARQIILQHHKWTEWSATSSDEDGSVSSTANTALVNAVRMADWADASYGVITFGLPYSCVVNAYQTVPEAGFHNILAGIGSRLSPDSLLGQLQVLKIFKW